MITNNKTIVIIKSVCYIQVEACINNHRHTLKRSKKKKKTKTQRERQKKEEEVDEKEYNDDIEIKKRRVSRYKATAVAL